MLHDLNELLGDHLDCHPRLGYRRCRWFIYLEKRFDLVSLSKVADWCAREGNGVARNEDWRLQALHDLETSILDGEFGAPAKPALFYLPNPIPCDRLGRFPLRLTADQIAMMRMRGHPIIADMWTPKTCANTWFTSRKIDLPPFVTSAGLITIEGKAESATPSRPVIAGRPPTRPVNRVDYTESDKPLLAEMHRILTATPPQARSRWDAALSVSDKAAGHGNVTSKAKRLLSSYSAVFSPEHG